MHFIDRLRGAIEDGKANRTFKQFHDSIRNAEIRYRHPKEATPEQQALYVKERRDGTKLAVEAIVDHLKNGGQASPLIFTAEQIERLVEKPDSNPIEELKRSKRFQAERIKVVTEAIHNVQQDQNPVAKARFEQGLPEQVSEAVVYDHLHLDRKILKRSTDPRTIAKTRLRAADEIATYLQVGSISALEGAEALRRIIAEPALGEIQRIAFEYRKEFAIRAAIDNIKTLGTAGNSEGRTMTEHMQASKRAEQHLAYVESWEMPALEHDGSVGLEEVRIPERSISYSIHREPEAPFPGM